MHFDKDDQEIKRLLQGMAIPEPSSNLEQRIIASAKPRPVTRSTQTTHGWISFSPTWGLAVAAMALLAVWVALPDNETGITPTQSQTQQVASVQPVQSNQQAIPDEDERYTANGMPLLADIDLMEEPELEMEELLLAGYSG